MRISSLQHRLTPGSQIRKNQGINKFNSAHSVPFKANNDDSMTCYGLNLWVLMQSPTIILQDALLHDGYNIEKIKKHGIYSEDDKKGEIEIESFLKSYGYKNMPLKNKRDINVQIPKPPEDVAAMCRVYRLLSDDFVDDSVEEYSERFRTVGQALSLFGFEIPDDSEVRELILQILRNTNRHNESVTKRLLDDPLFQNIHIPDAIANIKTKENANAANRVLDAAATSVTDKKASRALSIMVNEANPKNLPVIMKALDEQEFLIEDRDFVFGYLETFLRNFDYIAVSYIKDDNMTLKDVKELMQFGAQK